MVKKCVRCNVEISDNRSMDLCDRCGGGNSKKEEKTQKCMYCHTEIASDSVLGVCYKCGVGVWGEKMFKAIVKNMEDAQDRGDLFQGSVTDELKGGKLPKW